MVPTKTPSEMDPRLVSRALFWDNHQMLPWPHLRLFTQKYAIYVFAIFASVRMPAPKWSPQFQGCFSAPHPLQLSSLSAFWSQSFQNFHRKISRIIYRIQCLVIVWPSQSVSGLSIYLWPRALFRFQTSLWRCRELIFMPPLLREITHSLWGKASTPSIEPLGACY